MRHHGRIAPDLLPHSRPDSMTSEKSNQFSSLPIRPELLQSLAAANYLQMTPIQSMSAEAILGGKDVLAQAETGSGKTAAFAIGLLNRLNISMLKTQALIICPTRELSDQVAAEIRKLASALANTRIVTLCGGKPMHDQLASLKHEPHVVVGTPGRLKKHLEKGTLRLENVQTLVLDEADRMLDMGFHDDIMHIIDGTENDRQTLLFSATYPEDIIRISRAIQSEPLQICIVPEETGSQIEQVFVFANDEQKTGSLLRALDTYSPSNAIIFCNRKHQVQTLCDSLSQQGFHAAALHGDLDQRERDEALVLFANESVSYLVATDVAARGLDISALGAVINYDLTPDPETYLHRIGRTGRAGLDGMAITFVRPEEMHHVKALEIFLNQKITISELKPTAKNTRNQTPPPTITILIHSGKKDKIRPGDIVGALTASSALTNDDIGKITVLPKISYVAVDRNKADTAMDILAGGRIKKQKIRAKLLR